MLADKPIRIGYVVKRYPRYSETFIVNEILAHEAAGFEIEIFSLQPPSDTHFQNIISEVKAPVNYLPGQCHKATEFWLGLTEASEALPDLWPSLKMATGESSKYVYEATVLAKEAHLRGISHFHAHFGSAATSVTRLASHFSGIPYTFTAHAKDIFHESVRSDDLRVKVRDAAAVITVSDYNLKYLRSKFGQDAARVQRIYNGLNLEQFLYEAPRERQPRIVSVGRLVEKKGISYLIEACAILAHQGTRFDCLIIGVGELEAELQGQIEALGLQKTVKLVGPRPQQEIIKLVQSASVFAAPCIIGTDGNRDGLPTVLLEAMALGTPSISTDVTGIPEIIRNDETGLMVQQRDPVTLAAALERLLMDSTLRVELAEQARRLIEKYFDIHCNAASIRKVFDSVNMEYHLAMKEVA